MAMSSSNAAPEATEAHIKRHLSFLLSNSPIYAHLFSAARLQSATPGLVVIHLDLQSLHLNSKSSLHGSVSATLIDFMGGVAIASYDNRDNTGVSTDMHVSFLSGAKAGETLDIEGRVDRCGGTLAYTAVTIRKLSTGDVVAMGSHTKFVKQR